MQSTRYVDHVKVSDDAAQYYFNGALQLKSTGGWRLEPTSMFLDQHVHLGTSDRTIMSARGAVGKFDDHVR